MNPRQVLGVSSSAGPAEIKAAYRKLAMKHHPDVDSSPGAVKRMAEINAAWDMLKGPAGPSVSEIVEAARRAREEREASLRRQRAAEVDRRARELAARQARNRARQAAFNEASAQAQLDGIKVFMNHSSTWNSATRGGKTQTMADLFETLSQAPFSGPLQQPEVEEDGSSFTDDPCDFKMPFGMYQGQRLGDILRDHEWYGEEVDNLRVGHPIKALYREARRHYERELKGRPVHEW